MCLGRNIYIYDDYTIIGDTMVVYECKCKICGKEFRRRRAQGQPEPKYCSQACYSIRMKQCWNDKEYRDEMVRKHKENPTRYWLGKKRFDMMGEKNPRWKPIKGDWINERGYRVLYRPDYKYSNKKGSIHEHRYVWTNANNMGVPESCVIHHINKDKLDNRLENLQLMSASEHTKFHQLGQNNSMSKTNREKRKDVRPNKN